MAPVNGKIVQGINSDDNQLGLDVDFKNYTHDFKQNNLLSLQSTKCQNCAHSGTLQNGLNQSVSNRSTQNDIKNGKLPNGKLKNGLTNNGLTTEKHSIRNDDDEEDDEESLIHNKLVPLYTSLLDAIGK